MGKNTFLKAPYLVPDSFLAEKILPSAGTDYFEPIRSEPYPSCCISCAALQFSLEFPLAVSTLTTPIVPKLVERCPTSPPPTSTQWHLALTTYHAGIWRCPLNRRARLNFPGPPHQISLTPLMTPLRRRGSGPIARSVASSHALNTTPRLAQYEKSLLGRHKRLPHEACTDTAVRITPRDLEPHLVLPSGNIKLPEHSLRALRYVLAKI